MPSANSQEKIQIAPKFDHLLFFTTNNGLKDSLDQFFSPAEKLTTIHKNQGTKGYYYLFYNTYIELLFIEDSAQIKRNEVKFGSDYSSRWLEEQTTNPISFGMIMNDGDTTDQMKHFHLYQSDDAAEGEYYLMAKGNRDVSQAMIYVSQAQRAYQAINSADEIQLKPKEIQEDLRQYLNHPNGLKRVNKIIYTYPVASTKDYNLSLLNQNSMIELIPAKERTLTLIFDNNRSNKKEFQINPYTKLIIEY